MKYSVKNGKDLAADCIVAVVYAKGGLSAGAKAADAAWGGAAKKVIALGDFSGKAGEVLLLHGSHGAEGSRPPKRLLLAGAGNPKKFDAKAYTKMLQGAFKALLKSRAASVHFDFQDLSLKDRDGGWLSERLALEAERAVYRYEETKSSKKKPHALKSISLAPPEGESSSKAAGTSTKAAGAALKHLRQGAVIGKAVNRARQLGNLPGNICTPNYLAAQARKLAGRYDSLSVKVLGEQQMSRLGMGSLLSVGAGSAQESKLIVLHYRSGKGGGKGKDGSGKAKDGSKPYAIVGKGITFDTGGISLKPGAAMDEMKFDMCGAASVIATMGGVAELKLPVDVVGVVAAAENMPGSRATKPGDIVTSMSGKTIEILNTDAEGRLVLCDALTYTERFKPRTVIDIATLTGAAAATFGPHATALLSNDRDLADTLLEKGRHSLDRAWELPLWDEYQSQLDSNFADFANIGGRRAGTITAACFLSRFTDKFKWAHLDIAGSAWRSGPGKGATGRPVGLLLEYLRTRKA